MLLWTILYCGLALLLVVRGFIPMWATWRATDPHFEAERCADDGDVGGPDAAWNDPEIVELLASGFSDEGVYRITSANRQVLMVRLWLRHGGDSTLATVVAKHGGSPPGASSCTFSTFLDGGIGWLETAAARRRPGLPGEVVQVVPHGSPDALLAAHQSGLRRLADYGIAAGPVVDLDGLSVMRHQMLVARRQMRRQPLGWLMATLLHNVRPVRTETIGAVHDLGPELVRVGLRAREPLA